METASKAELRPKLKLLNVQQTEERGPCSYSNLTLHHKAPGPRHRIETSPEAPLSNMDWWIGPKLGVKQQCQTINNPDPNKHIVRMLV